jgi:REP element-mobilizing transposase RayT
VVRQGTQGHVRDDEDRGRFVDALGASVLRHGVLLHLYCLMDNHAHLVVETPHANLSGFMQNFQTRYIVWFNRRHQRWGHLMQGRYGARLVEADRYLLQLSRYLHLNPVRTRAAETVALKEQLQLLGRYRWEIGVVGKLGSSPQRECYVCCRSTQQGGKLGSALK